jgi:hypothetical protein
MVFLIKKGNVMRGSPAARKRLLPSLENLRRPIPFFSGLARLAGESTSAGSSGR